MRNRRRKLRKGEEIGKEKERKKMKKELGNEE